MPRYDVDPDPFAVALRDLSSAAYHEAGHAVVGHILRHTPRYVVLRGHYEGRTHYRAHSVDPHDTRPRAAARLESLAASICAGPLAEQRYMGALGDGNDADITQLASIVAHLAGSPEAIADLTQRVQDRAQTLVDEYWPFIEAVAHRLKFDRRISGGELRRIRDGLSSVRP